MLYTPHRSCHDERRHRLVVVAQQQQHPQHRQPLALQSHHRVAFLARVIRPRYIAKGGSVCLSVCPSVRHTREPLLYKITQCILYHTI